MKHSGLMLETSVTAASKMVAWSDSLMLSSSVNWLYVLHSPSIPSFPLFLVFFQKNYRKKYIWTAMARLQWLNLGVIWPVQEFPGAYVKWSVDRLHLVIHIKFTNSTFKFSRTKNLMWGWIQVSRESYSHCIWSALCQWLADIWWVTTS